MIFHCHECGKEVDRPYMDEYVYKKQSQKTNGYYTTLYFCSWNCMRKYEKEREKKQWKKG